MRLASTGFLSALAACLSLALFAPACGAAAIHQYLIDPDLFPLLDQHDVGGVLDPAFACGPAAAITSLAYLDEEHLIPRRDPPRPLYDDMAAAAGVIAGASYMGTAANGTRVPPYIIGMNQYLTKLEGISHFTISAQMGAVWPADPNNPKPAFVTDGTPPTWQFLLSNLELNRAVQIGIDGLNPDGSRGGHFLTLTGLYFADFDFDDVIDQGTDIAYIRYIDPWSGQAGQADIWVNPGSSVLRSNYVGAAHDGKPALQFEDVRLIAAVAESVPEPGTFALLGFGFVSLVMVRRRRH